MPAKAFASWPKYRESLPLMRLMTGSGEGLYHRQAFGPEGHPALDRA